MEVFDDTGQGCLNEYNREVFDDTRVVSYKCAKSDVDGGLRKLTTSLAT